MSEADEALTAGQAASPLGALKLPSQEGILEVSEVKPLGRLVVRAAPDSADSLARALGSALLGRVNTATTTEACTALRLGPDEWLLLADAEADPWLAARIAEAARGVAVAVVDVSHRNAGLLLEGPAVETVLSAGCPLPLEARAFPVGKATRTLYGKAEIVLWRRGPETFQIEVAASFSAYLVALLAVAIADEAMIRRAQGA